MYILKNFVQKSESKLFANVISNDISRRRIMLFFFRLFSKNHHLKKLFTKLITSEVSGEVFLNEELLQNHARIVMESLSAAVECLHDSKQLTILLIAIGERHAMYGVKPHMIRVRCLSYLLL